MGSHSYIEFIVQNLEDSGFKKQAYFVGQYLIKFKAGGFSAASLGLKKNEMFYCHFTFIHIFVIFSG